MEGDARTISPDRSLASKLKHPLRKKVHNADSSSVSIASHDTEVEKGGFLRASIDKIIDHRHHSDTEVRRSSFDPGRRLAKLVPSRTKRRKSVAIGEGAQIENSSDGTGLGISSNNRSGESLSNRAASIDSSLLTDDEDPEPSARPFLDTRPSHAGYLTLSSPLIAAETFGSSATPVQQLRHYPTAPSSPTVLPTVSIPLGEQSPALSATSQDNVTPRLEASSAKRTTPQLAVNSQPSLEPPSTFITPPTPDIPQASSLDTIPRKKVGSRLTLGPLQLKPTISPPSIPSQDSVPYHRRVRSVTSNSGKIINPLTPAIEEAKTPGGTLTQPPGSSGFFTSVFSATQNAVNQLSNTFSTASSPTGPRTRSTGGFGVADKAGTGGGEEVIIPGDRQSSEGGVNTEPEPAIATLGSGNLSFSHLGITDVNGDANPMPIKDTLSVERRRRAPSIVQSGGISNRNEEVSAAEAVSAAYSDKMTPEKAVSIHSEAVSNGRPQSIASAVGSIPDTTPPASIANGTEGAITRRSNSVRSRLSERRKRNRNNSVAAGGAIAAAISANHSALANPSKGRVTGFALASGKRNKDFHAFFKSVPEDDFLVEDYSAALQRDILLQGRLYISERHICFSSNILGWVTNLVVNFDEVIALEKKMTAVIFPNAIVVHTSAAKHTFASLIGREATYDLIVAVWKSSHANIKATEHGHALEGSSGGKVDGDDSSDSSDETSEEFYDEDEDDDGTGSFMDANASDNGSDAGDVPRPKMPSPGATGTGTVLKANDAPAAGAASPGGFGEFPGPATHSPTECTDGDAHYEKHLVDTTIPAPLGKIYAMMFGPQSGVFMRKFLVEDQKSGDVQYEDDKKGLGEEQKVFNYSFIKKLDGAIGPKQTKCIVTQTLDAFDLEKAVSVTCSTQTPDVPSGNVFVTKTKYCLMWGPGNSTRLIMTCAVEWSGKSWIKGPIEKGANDGQDKYGKDIVAFFKTQTGKPPGRSGTLKGSKGKVRRKKSHGEADGGAVGSTSRKASNATAHRSSWGIFEPLHSTLAPVADLFSPLMNSTGVLSVMMFIIIVLLLRQVYHRNSDGGSNSRSVAALTAQRLAAYEELWRREESDLWSWLEDRVGLDAMDTTMHQSQQPVLARPMEGKVEQQSMSDRQIQEAIRVTEEKLNALKQVVEKKKSGGHSAPGTAAGR